MVAQNTPLHKLFIEWTEKIYKHLFIKRIYNC